jgi:hypothetical protein
VDKFIWQATIDKHTCNACKINNGREVYIGKGMNRQRHPERYEFCEHDSKEFFCRCQLIKLDTLEYMSNLAVDVIVTKKHVESLNGTDITVIDEVELLGISYVRKESGG